MPLASNADARSGETAWRRDMDSHWGTGWGWWVIGPIMMVLFWGSILWLIAIIGRGRDGHRGQSRRESPREIADRRLADGDIDEMEHECILGRLSR